MARYVGILILFFCCAYGGYLFSAAEYGRIRMREGLLSLIKHIRQRIEFFREPLDVIYERFDDGYLEKCGFTVYLREHGLSDTILRYNTAFAHDSFTEASLSAFAVTLGTLPTEEQISSCDYVITLLEEQQSIVKMEYPKKRKLCLSLGILIGASAAILLI